MLSFLLPGDPISAVFFAGLIISIGIWMSIHFIIEAITHDPNRKN